MRIQQITEHSSSPHGAARRGLAACVAVLSAVALSCGFANSGAAVAMPTPATLGAKIFRDASLCGQFKVPTLRNVAVTAPYFHNGRFKTLKEVVGFYVRRDSNPEEWYPLAADGSVRKFDDLPQQYHGNVNVTEVPYNRHLGEALALTPDEIDLVVEFLNTLTDHYQP